MHITSISNNINNNYKSSNPKKLRNNNINFTGVSIKKQRRELLILFSENLFGSNFNVRYPNSPLEKSALLTVLKAREALDKFYNLRNELFRSKHGLNINKGEIGTITTYKDKLAKQGIQYNNDAYTKLLENEMEAEKNAHPREIKFFEKLKELANVYIDKKIIRKNEFEAFYNNIAQNNINTNGSLSTTELIKMISKHNINKNVQSTQELTSSINQQNNIFEKIKEDYITFYREYVDLYNPSTISTAKAKNYITNKYKNFINSSSKANTKVQKILQDVDHSMFKKITEFNGNLPLYKLPDIRAKAYEIEDEMRKLGKELTKNKKAQKDQPKNKRLKIKELEIKDKIENAREEWQQWILFHEECNKRNIETLKKHGLDGNYAYFTELNKEMQICHKYATKLSQEFNVTIKN